MINYGRRIGSHEKPAYGTVITDPFHPLSQGLVGYWLMNEGGGNRAYDISGHGNHGTLTNGPTWDGSKFGGGVNLDGSDDYVSVGDNASLRFGSGDYSISAWFKATSGITGHQGIVAKGGFQVNDAYTIYLYSTSMNIRWYVDGTSNLSGATTGLNDGIWHHAVCVKNGDVFTIFLDGEQDGTSTISGTSITTTDSQVIGARSGGSSAWFNGIIGPVHIWSRALTAWEAKQLCHDPFCNLLRVPIRRYSVAAAAGLPIPVAMHHYRQRRRA